MTQKKAVIAICVPLILVICLILWGAAALDYADAVAVGEYRFKRGEETSILVLNSDHTFRQLVKLGGKEQRAEGTWRRVGEGGVSFSKNFIVVSGDEPEPDGSTFAELHKTLGLFPALRLSQYHVLWYGKTSSDGSLVGTYKGDEPEVTAELTLNADHSFHQSITRGDSVSETTGTWSQGADGTVRFSRAFLKTSGEALGADETATSQDSRGSNLQIEISLAEHVPQPVFHKRVLFW